MVKVSWASHPSRWRHVECRTSLHKLYKRSCIADVHRWSLKIVYSSVYKTVNFVVRLIWYRLHVFEFHLGRPVSFTIALKSSSKSSQRLARLFQPCLFWIDASCERVLNVVCLHWLCSMFDDFYSLFALSTFHASNTPFQLLPSILRHFHLSLRFVHFFIVV